MPNRHTVSMLRYWLFCAESQEGHVMGTQGSKYGNANFRVHSHNGDELKQ